MSRFLAFLFLLSFSLSAFAKDPVTDIDGDRQKNFSINMMDEIVSIPLGWDDGPTYRMEYFEGNELDIVWHTKANLYYLEATEIALLRASIKRAVVKLNEATLPQIAAEVMNTLRFIPRSRTAAGSEVEVINLQFFDLKAIEVFQLAQKETDSKRKLILDDAVYYLERASAFYARLGERKADVCFMQQLQCRITQGCFTECEILAAKRKGDAVCALHGDYVISWFKPVKIATLRWSAKRAALLGGKNDMDSEAASKWLHVMKPIFIETCGQEWTDKVYADPILRTAVWLMSARTMRCTALNYKGTAPPLSETENKEALSDFNFVNENFLALQKHMQVISVQCCNPVIKAIPQDSVILKPEPIPAPLHIEPDCGCGGTTQILSMPLWCK